MGFKKDRELLKNKKNNQENTSRNLSKETVFKFQELYLRKEGINISFEEAESKVFELIDYVRSIYKPIKII